MENSGQSKPTIRFGVFEINPRSGEVRKSGTRVRLQDQPFKVLLALLEHPGEVVSREELRQRIWPTESFGDFDHAVNVAVGKLRIALGDSADVPRYVETLHRRGYRFVCPISVPIGQEAVDAERSTGQFPQSADVLSSAVQDAVGQKRRLQAIGDARIEIEEACLEPKEATPEISVLATRRGRAFAAPILVGVLVGTLLSWMLMRMARPTEAKVPHLTSVGRLTHDPEYSRSPTWSPDGTMLAFSSNRSGNYEIYVRRVEGGQEVNVTNDPSQDIEPAFSPDGNWIAFVSTRSSRGAMVQMGRGAGDNEFRAYGGDIWLVPALGGQARLLARDGNYPAWHPKGNKVLYVSGTENHRSLMEVTVDGGASRAALPAESSNWEISRVQYSGGRWITFETSGRTIFIMPADGGQPRQVLEGVSHTWDPSGRRIYYCSPGFSGGTGVFSVEIVERDGKLKGEPKSVGLVTATLSELAMSGDGRHVAATEMENSLNLTRLPLNASGNAPAGPEEELSRGLVSDQAPAVSPDSKIVAYISNRLGHNELWMLHLDTRHLERMQIPGRDIIEERPEWFPDGTKLQVMRMYPDGKRAPWVVFIDGSHAEEILPSSHDIVAGDETPVSPDGLTVTYPMMSNGFYQLFAFNIVTRQSKQMTFTAGDKYGANLSPDGRWMIYSSNAGGTVQVWKMPARGGTPEQMTKGNDRVRHMFYSRDGHWLYFQPNHRNIYRMPSTGGAVQQVTHFVDPTEYVEEPTISPDGRYLYYTRSNGGSSLWLLTVGNEKSRPSL
jgi:Tol biopolymer transport system component/DNA-binding winged helix-turn-helix (wHTH) protein